MRRTILLAALGLTLPVMARAQRYDTKWRRIAAKDLGDLELSGGDVRVNNMLVNDERPRSADGMITHVFSASAVRRGGQGQRQAIVQIIGMGSDNVPSITSQLVFNFSENQNNRLTNESHRFLADPKEIAATDSYFVRFVVQ